MSSGTTSAGTNTASGANVVPGSNVNTASGLDVTSGLNVASGNELDSAELPPFQSLSRQIYHDSDSDMDDNDYLDDNEHLRAYEACYAKYQRQRNEA